MAQAAASLDEPAGPAPYLPLAHNWHAAAPVAAEYEPLGHTAAVAEPPAQAWPRGQSAHVVVMLVPLVVDTAYWPALHASVATELHASGEVLPSGEMGLLSGQGLHADALAAPTAALYVFSGHRLHLSLPALAV